MTSIERYTVPQIITALQQARGMVTVAARSLGCNPQTVRNYIARHATVAQALHEERERTTDVAELALYKAIQQGESWAIALYLKTIGRDRGYVETTRNLNLNLTPQDIEKLDDAQLDQLYKQVTDTLSN